MANPRKPVAAYDEDGIPVVVCDDGSVWRHYNGDPTWYEGPPIPGTARATPVGDADLADVVNGLPD